MDELHTNISRPLPQRVCIDTSPAGTAAKMMEKYVMPRGHAPDGETISRPGYTVHMYDVKNVLQACTQHGQPTVSACPYYLYSNLNRPKGADPEEVICKAAKTTTHHRWLFTVFLMPPGRPQLRARPGPAAAWKYIGKLGPLPNEKGTISAFPVHAPASRRRLAAFRNPSEPCGRRLTLPLSDVVSDEVLRVVLGILDSLPERSIADPGM